MFIIIFRLLTLICCLCSSSESARPLGDAAVIQLHGENTLQGNTLPNWCGCYGPMNCPAGVQTSLILGVALSPEIKRTVVSHKFISEALCRQFSLPCLFSFRGRAVDVRRLPSACLQCLLWSLCGCILRHSPASGAATKQMRLAASGCAQARGARAASAPNWGKMLSIWSLHVGCCWGGETPLPFSLVVVAARTFCQSTHPHPSQNWYVVICDTHAAFSPDRCSFRLTRRAWGSPESAK